MTNLKQAEILYIEIVLDDGLHMRLSPINYAVQSWYERRGVIIEFGTESLEQFQTELRKMQET